MVRRTDVYLIHTDRVLRNRRAQPESRDGTTNRDGVRGGDGQLAAQGAVEIATGYGKTVSTGGKAGAAFGHGNVAAIARGQGQIAAIQARDDTGLVGDIVDGIAQRRIAQRGGNISVGEDAHPVDAQVVGRLRCHRSHRQSAYRWWKPSPTDRRCRRR